MEISTEKPAGCVELSSPFPALGVCAVEMIVARKWGTLRLLAEKVVELGWVERVSVMTVQRTLKKTNCSLIGRSIGSRPGAAPHS